MMIYPTLAAEIARKGLSVKDLSDATGIKYQSLMQKVNGKRDFKLSEAARIKEIFPGIEIEELFKERGE